MMCNINIPKNIRTNISLIENISLLDKNILYIIYKDNYM